MRRTRRAILFDLFGTLVRFDARRIPVLEKPDGAVRSTVPAYVAVLREVAPACSPATFHDALLQVSVAIIDEQRESHREVPSQQRFERALAAVDPGSGELVTRAARLCAAHMLALERAVYLPDGHLEIVERIRARRLTGLVSNFDHAPTARVILERTGLAPLLGCVVISDDFGRRKPDVAIFHEGLRQLGVAAEESCFVGDSYGDDVLGARAAGMEPIWLRRNRQPGEQRETDTTDVQTIEALGDLERVLAR